MEHSVNSESTDGNGQESVLALGSRLKSPPSELLVSSAFRYELDHQLCLNESMGLVDMAYLLTAIECHIVPRCQGTELLLGVLDLQRRPNDFEPSPEFGDLYTNRENWLDSHTNSTGWLGVGRARRESTTGAFYLKARNEILLLHKSLSRTVKKVLERVEQSATDIMPDYTYLQRAQPTTLGHYLLSFVYPMLRDLSRLQNAYERVNLSTLGCGSTNGSLLKIDRNSVARRLGYSGLCTHTRDAMWQADTPVEVVASLVAIAINLDRLAEDLQIFSTEEFGLIELSDCHARSSKIMPQKKNPFALTYVRQLANHLIGVSTTICASGRTPSGQPDNRQYIYGALPAALTETTNATELMGEVVENLRFDRDRAREAVYSSAAAATSLTEILIKITELDPREAHRLVGHLVSESVNEGIVFSSLTAGTVKNAANCCLGKRLELSEASLKSALNAESTIASHDGIGGAAKASVEEMLLECREIVSQREGWCEVESQRVGASTDKLLREVAEFCR
uniref:argininosuccinate lyase n=1 Tax=Alteromonadaceae bacterium PE-TB08W TaxID=1199097 RepID=A0A3G9DXF2_9ALTE|nr:fumarate lyase [Alteromonadaceae bacterium PE-TB08W]